MHIDEQFRLIGELLLSLRDEVRIKEKTVDTATHRPNVGISDAMLREAIESADRSIPLPSLDLTRSLYAAVVRSQDEDVSATVALEKLQSAVLMAVARFECAMVIV